MRELTIRWRLTLFFCLAAGVLLAVCYGGFYVIFQRVLREQFDQRLSEIAAPIIFDIAGDPEDKDVDMLDLPYEYFEVLDTSGKVLQRSRNLNADLPVTVQRGLQSVRLSGDGEVRLTDIPF
jgi:hypothetical protein